MASVLRPLLPVIGAALLLTAVLVLWIRREPADLPRTVQVALSLLLVLAVGLLIAMVLRVEREITARDHADDA